MSGKVYGAVYQTNTQVADAKVYLIQMMGLTSFQIVNSAYTIQGEYAFHNVLQGNYIVKATPAPNVTNLIFSPTYHLHALHWHDADVVHVDSDKYQINIYLISGSQLSGPGVINGHLSWSSGFKVSSTESAALGQVTVLLKNLDNEMLKHTFTSSGGQFTFEDLPYGTYQVYVEWLGKTTYPAVLTISEQLNQSAFVEIFVGESIYSNPTTIFENKTDEKISIYPNPATDWVYVEISNLPVERFNMRIFDLTARQIVMNAEEQICNGGKCLVELQLTGFSSGVYIIEIKAGNNLLREKLIISNTDK